jgi:phosphoglycerol transferase
MAPDVLYARGRVANTLAFTRDPGEVDFSGLKLAQLLLPSFRHRWGPLRELRSAYNLDFPLRSESPVLGAVAATGLLILLVVMVSALAGRPSSGTRTSTGLRHLAFLTLASLGAAGVGGFSTFIALFVTDSARAWNRMSIFIAAFCLAAVGLSLDSLVLWVRGRRPDSRTFVVALPTVLGLVVLGLGIMDQTSTAYVPDYAGVRASYYSDAAYVREIEEQLPAGAAVYQMPHQIFPESPPVNGVRDPDPLRLYLSSTDTRWSAGGLKGRPKSDWPVRLAGKPISTVVPLLAVSGFSGISVDRLALGGAADGVEADLTGQLGAGPTAASSDGRFAFWPLAGAEADMATRYDESEREALREMTLLPPVLYAGPDFPRPLMLDGKVVWRTRNPRPQLLLDNPRDGPLAVHLSFAVGTSWVGNFFTTTKSSASPWPRRATNVEVRLPGRAPIALDVSQGPVTVEADLMLRPGRSVVQLRLTSAPRAPTEAPVAAAFDFLDIELTDPVFESFQP